MFGTLLAVVLLGGAALLVGQAVCILTRGAAAWYGGAVGLAALIVVCDITIRLPGDATTAAVICGLLVAGSGVLLARRGALRPPAVGVIVGGATLGLLTLPFIANWRVGLLGVQLNNDTSIHLRWAEGLRDAHFKALTPPSNLYPLGPHSLVATLGQATGIDLDLVFTALLLVIPVLMAVAALAALDGAPIVARIVLAPMVGLVYLAVAYTTEGAFKETLVACFLLTFALILDDIARGPVSVRSALLLALPVAGTLYTYSYAGAAWPFAVAGLWLVLDVGSRLIDGGRREATRRVLQLVPLGIAGAVLAAVLVIPDLGHMFTFLDAATQSPAGTSAGGIPATDLGNLAGPLPLWEALGIWMGPDFRFPPPRGLFNAGIWSGVALAAVALGAAALLARRRFGLPAALAACFLVYWRSHSAGDSPYITAKSLAIAAPIAMAVITAGLSQPITASARVPGVRLGRAVLLGAVLVGAFWSTVTVLRSGPVAPRATQDQLARLASVTRGRPTLFLGNDDYYQWKLRETVSAQPAYAAPIAIEFRPEKPWVYGQAFDIDTITPATVDRFAYVITPRTPYQSEIPANLRLVRTTGLFSLWRRTGPTPVRGTLPTEAGSPGGVLRCDTPAGRAIARQPGIARVMAAPRTFAPPPDLLPGQKVTLPVRLPRGSWTLSTGYVGSQAVTFRTRGLQARLPAMLDRPGPIYQLGRVRGGPEGPRAITISMSQPGPARLRSPILRGNVGSIVATRDDVAPTTIPLRRACGRYVDWYRTRG